MTALAPTASGEAQFLEGLRATYEQQGFTFHIRPPAHEIPVFFGSYRPDAIAKKPGLSVAIEVKQQSAYGEQASLQQIRKIFEGHPDWRFDVVFMGARQTQRMAIPLASPARLRARIDEVRKMLSQGQNRAAFVMAWSLLEAALQSRTPASSGIARAPGTVLQTLAMNGYIDRQLEHQMRSLIDLRNRIIHGDIEVEPSAADVQLVISAITETLEADAA